MPFLGPYIATPPTVTPRWTRTSAGTTLAIDLDTVKDFVNRPREDTFWDTEITSFIKVATAEIEKECSLALTACTFRVTLPVFEDRIKLSKYRPFLDVTGIEYVAAETGEITTCPTDIYHALPIEQDCGMVFLGDGKAWPNAARRHDAVRITVRAGFGISDGELTAGYPERPSEIDHALLMTIAALDMARGDTQAGASSNVTVYAMKNSRGGSIIPGEAKSLLRNYVYRWVTI